MSNNNDGGPAFARPGNEFRYADGEVVRFAAFGGMSLRDYFAGQALHLLLTDKNFSGNIQSHTDFVRIMAKQAYTYADAMLTERSKERT